VPKEGPAPGQYNPDKAIKLVKPKEYEAFITGEEFRKNGVLLDGSKPSVEAGNDPGKYDGHLSPFGSGLKKIDMGSKYKFVPKEGPAPGQYSVSTSLIKPRVPEVIIKEDIIQEKRKLEPSPEPGRYDAHLTPFGSDLKKVDMGSKYKFVPKEGPGPGTYSANESAVKSRVRSALIREDVSPYRRPQDTTPDPGTYDGHLTSFGSGLKKVDMGSKYKFVPKEGPAPGQYSARDSVVKPRVKSVLIKENVNSYRRP
jgi:hypothetical protein